MNFKYQRNPNLQYLGTYTLTPAHTEIEVVCYGKTQPFEKQALEYSGCGKYSELIQVTTEVWVDQAPYETIDISNYLSSDVWDELEHLINNGENV